MKNAINKEILILKILLIFFAFFQDVSYTIDLKPIFDFILFIVGPTILYRNKNYFENIKKDKYFKVMLVFIGLVFISTLLNFNKLIIIDLDVITMFTIMFLVFVPSIKYYDRKVFIEEFKIINKIIIALTLIGSIISLIMYYTDYTQIIEGVKFFGNPKRVTGVYENKLYGIYSNPNYTAGYIGFAATILQGYLTVFKDKKDKILKLSFIFVVTIINMIFVYYTASLGSIVLTSTTLLLLGYSYILILAQRYCKKNVTTSLKVMTIVFLSLGCIFILINVYDVVSYMIHYKEPGYVYQPVFEFLTKGNPDIALYGPITGRAKIFDYAISHANESPIIGHSISQSFPIILSGILFTHAHNDFLQILLAYGYPVFILIVGFFIATIIVILKKGWYIIFRIKENKDNQIYYIFLIIVISIFIRTSIEIGNIYYFKIESLYFWTLFSYLLYVNPIEDNKKKIGE